jgi:hypothetical protein
VSMHWFVCITQFTNLLSCNKLQVKASYFESHPRIKDKEKEEIIDLDGEILIKWQRTYKCEKSLM